MELVEIFGSENIVSVIKAARLRWAGHVMRMSDDRVPKKVLVNRVDGTRPRGRPKKRWIDCVESDLKELGVCNKECRFQFFFSFFRYYSIKYHKIR